MHGTEFTWTHDSKYLLYRWINQSEQQTFGIIEPATGAKTQIPFEANSPAQIQFDRISSDDQFIALQIGGYVKFYSLLELILNPRLNLPVRSQLCSLVYNGPAYCVNWSPQGHQAFVSYSKGHVVKVGLVDPTMERPIIEYDIPGLKADSGFCCDVMWSPDLRYAILAQYDQNQVARLSILYTRVMQQIILLRRSNHNSGEGPVPLWGWCDPNTLSFVDNATNQVYLYTVSTKRYSTTGRIWGDMEDSSLCSNPK